MKKPEDINIVLIGAGNLATNLAKALKLANCNISQVYSRTEESARTLANLLGATFTTSISKLKHDADLYIVSLKDSAIEELLPEIVRGKENALFVHTSGSIPIDIWKEKAKRYGVFYPMQTFSKQREVSFNEIPIFLEAGKKEDLQQLEELAARLSNKVFHATSEQRRYLHMAAVFACNFTNHMYAICEKILSEHQLPFEAMLPLIDETALKIHQLSPIEAQTGPAIRYDRNIIDKHIELLATHPDIQQIYEIISKNIYTYDKLRPKENQSTDF